MCWVFGIKHPNPTLFIHFFQEPKQLSSIREIRLFKLPSKLPKKSFVGNVKLLLSKHLKMAHTTIAPLPFNTYTSYPMKCRKGKKEIWVYTRAPVNRNNVFSISINLKIRDGKIFILFKILLKVVPKTNHIVKCDY